MTLGQKIKKLRNEQGLTQKALADLVNVTFQTVSKWENDENEPDVSTLRRLAALFGCTMDYLLSTDDAEEPIVEEETNEEPVVRTETIIIHQKELRVCEHCKKDIPENDLVMEDICVTPGGRGRRAEYRKAYYHSACLEEVKKERAEAKKRERAANRSSGMKKSFGWGIAAGILSFGIALAVFLAATSVHPALSILFSVLIAYGMFAMLYCIVSGSYIGEVFIWCASLSIKFPGLIFSWDIEGIVWVITMKIFFAILGFLIGVLALIFAIVFSAALGAVSFPFVLIYNNKHDYEDTL